MENNEKNYLKRGVVKILYDHFSTIALFAILTLQIDLPLDLMLKIIFSICISILLLSINYLIINKGYSKVVLVFWSIVTTIPLLLFLTALQSHIAHGWLKGADLFFILIWLLILVVPNILLLIKDRHTYITIVLMPTIPWALIFFAVIFGGPQ
ncbi:hypothetical protein LJB88_05055 [Erysipelotrichaceae bacterium OttesenSCG-928-M19]|nr:hypothetical protein [Erysipelotrichaceae bacterium OttesenSCG-928-M19]